MNGGTLDQLPVTRRALLASGVAAVAVGASSCSTMAPDSADPWSQSHAILARIKPPSIPSRQFSIDSYGARPETDCTAAIAEAIRAANAAGGGRVIVPAGVWTTGAIYLKSRVELHVAKGATLKFSRDPSAYLPVVLTRHEGIELMNYAPFIYAYGETDIALTGEGTLDGQADASNWWDWGARARGATGDRTRLADMGEKGVPVDQRVFGAGKFIRTNFVQPYRCKNVLIEGLTIVASPMWEIHPVECTNVIVRGLDINSHGPNNDGCDPESCRDVLIENCTFDTGDDCIAIKSGRNNEGRRLKVPTENVIIRNCRMKDGHGGFTLGSECTAGIRNVFVENCKMDSPHLDNAMRFKNNAMRGGTLENIYIRNIEVGQVAGAVVNVDYSYGEGPNGPYTPIFRNMVIEKLTSTKSRRAVSLQGYANAPLEGITLRDCRFDNAGETGPLKHLTNFRAERVSINGQPLSALPTIGDSP